MTVHLYTGTRLTKNQGAENFRHLEALDASVKSIKSPDFGAAGDGVTDDAAAFQAAVTAQVPIFLPPGDYVIGSTVRVPDSGFLDLRAIPGTVTITSPQDVIPFGKASGATTSVARIALEGINFNGEHERGTTWPYSTATSNYGMLLCFSITANPGNDDAEVVIRNCAFYDFQSYPFQVWHFRRVEVSGCYFTRCKDPGFLFCQNVIFNNNMIEWGADNGVSISRGCKNFTATGNVIRDCEIAGIWVAGYTPTAVTSSTLTITGTYTQGGAVTVTSSNASFWNYQYLNTYFLVEKSGNTVVVKITAISSFTVATGIAVQAVPAALQGAASDSWEHAPGTGPESFTVTGNTIVGCDTGVRGTAAARRGNVSGNTIIRPGFVADSQVYSLGSIITGTTSLEVADASAFAANDWIIIDPPTSLDGYFIAKISSIASNTLTLDRNAPVTYSNEVVRLVHRMSAAAGVHVTGEDEKLHQFADSIKINGNVVVDYYKHGVLLGSTSTGSVKRISITGNDFWCPGSVQDTSTHGVIRLNEYSAQASSYIIVRDNNTDDTSQFFAAYVRGTTSRTFDVRNNYHPNITLPANIIAVYDADNANADISYLHNAPGNLSFIAGRSYALAVSGNSNNSVSAVDQVYLYPFYIDKPFSFSGGTIYVATAGTGSSVKAAIYANSPTSMRPLGAPLFVDNTGVATTSSSTAAALALGTGTLQPGWYWLATKHTGTLPVVQAAAAYNQFFNKYFGAASGSGAVVGLRTADSYSNNMPTYAEGASFTNQTAAVPVFSLTAA